MASSVVASYPFSMKSFSPVSAIRASVDRRLRSRRPSEIASSLSMVAIVIVEERLDKITLSAINQITLSAIILEWLKMTSTKVWFITGASRGFGRVWTEAALKRGDKVAATARNPTGLDELATVYGDAVLVLPLDVTDRDAVFEAVARAHRHFGRLDVILSNAGYGYMGAIEELEPEQAKANFDTNVFGTLSVVQAALPILRGAGQRSYSDRVEHRRNYRFPDRRNLYRDQICRRSDVGSAGRGSGRVRYQSDDHRTRALHHRVSLIGAIPAGHRRVQSHTSGRSLVIQARRLWRSGSNRGGDLQSRGRR